MKTKQELASLHQLFLSADPNDWALAANRCSKAEFEKVLELEVERICSGDCADFNKSEWDIYNEHREDDTVLCWLYDLNTLLGICLRSGIDVVSTSDTRKQLTCSIYRGFLKFDADEVVIGSECCISGPKFNDIIGQHIDCLKEFESECNSNTLTYLTDDFKAELEQIKTHWRNHFNQLKDSYEQD